MQRHDLLTAAFAQSGIGAQAGVSLSGKCTFRIGGAADLFIQPGSESEIVGAFNLVREYGVPFLVLGKGSNVLFGDEGFRGVVMHLGTRYSQIWREGDDVICESGADLSNVCEFAQSSGLAGLEFAYGIPGTVGGALYMNAGAYGSEVGEVISGARFVCEDGAVRELTQQQMGLEYRRSVFMGMSGAISRATFRLTPGNPVEIRAKMDDYMNRRREKQPLEYPSAGSTFKRPAGNYASALIDECGLKGMRVGGAAVSEKHAGFVINLGGATCKDVLELIAAVKDIVKAKTGYELECEVKIIDS